MTGAARTVAALHEWVATLRMSPNRQASVQESVRLGLARFGRETPRSLAALGLRDSSMDEIQLSRLELDLRIRVLRAWKERASLGTEPFAPLACYRGDSETQEITIDKRGKFDLGARGCSGACAMAARFRESPETVEKLISACAEKAGALAKSAGQMRRALDEVTAEVSSDECRAFGDAVYSFLCPPGGAVLTTNLRDHRVLAAAVDRAVASPAELLAAAPEGSS